MNTYVCNLGISFLFKKTGFRVWLYDGMPRVVGFTSECSGMPHYEKILMRKKDYNRTTRTLYENTYRI